MVKSIEQLLNGRYEYSVVPPEVTPSAVFAQTGPGEDHKGVITVTSADGQRLRGHGHVSDARIVLTQDRFTGTSFRVVYGVDVNGLTDGDEVLVYKTDPLNPVSDYDLLMDGEEVKKYKTDPLDPDTDKGGVRDGHEVIYDHTDPLDPSDDLLFFELNIVFDTDKDVIKPEFFAQLDKVAKVLLDNPGATAAVEGHADKRATSKRNYNIRLSEKRARAVARYFEGKGVSAARLNAVGYGFDHPKAPNDPVSGNLSNRRVEVYVSGAKPGKVNYVNPGK